MESTVYYPNLQVSHVFGRAWQTLKDNMGLVFGMVIVEILILLISAIIPLLPLILTGPLQAGVYYAFVRMLRGEEVEFSNMFDGFQQFGRALGVYLLYTLAVLAAMLLLIVPGIILAIGLLPAMYLILDDDYGVGDTLQEAWDMTRGYKWDIFVIMLAIMGMCILGLLVFIIGVFFTAVFAYVIMAAVYDELAQAKAIVESQSDAAE